MLPRANQPNEDLNANLGQIELSASMMCANLSELGRELQRLETAGIDSFHFDVMDAHFVPNIALSSETIAALRPLSELKFVVHLMVDDPAAFIGPMAEAGCDEMVFHIEAGRYPRRIMNQIERSGMVPGVAINPVTGVSALQTVADAPTITVMTVEPGFAGQPFIRESPARVREIRKLCGGAVRICADGHIDAVTTRLLAEAGANAFVCGTKSVFRGAHEVSAYADAIQSLRDALQIKAG